MHARETGTAPGESLLERDRELGSLDDLLGGLGDERAGFALIEGPAGIGKSRLLAEVRDKAAGEGFKVLSARGGELEGDFPFGVVRQLFEDLLADPEEAERLLDGAAAPARPVFEAVESGDEQGGFAALHGLYWLVANLAERPLVLAIDDLHWVDKASLRFVAYLLRRLEGMPVLVAATLRSAEPGTDPNLLAEIAHDPFTTTVRPGPLTEAAVTELVRDRLGEGAQPAFCVACHKATGGNPLLLRQLLAALAADGVEPTEHNAQLVSDIGPRAVSRGVLVRLGRLPGDAAVVAQAVAVLGESADVGTVAALAEVDEARVATATGDLAQAEILTREVPISFVHPLVRDAVYSELPAGERELRHTKAARILADDAGAGPEEIATHLLQMPRAGEDWVVKTLRRAARSAVNKGAAESATTYLRRALDEPPSEEIATQTLLELGIVEALTDAPAAVEHLRAAYQQLREPAARGLCANMLGRALLFTSRPEEGADIAAKTAEELPIELEDVSLSLVAFEAAATAFGVDRPEATERLKAFRDPRRIHTLGEKMMAAAAAYDWGHRNGPRDKVIALAKAALADDEIIEADHGLLPMYAIAGLILADTEEVTGAWDQMMGVAHRHGSIVGITTLHLWMGYGHYCRGDLPEAEQSLRTAIQSFKTYGYGENATVYVAAHLGGIMLDRGDPKQARELFALGTDPGPGPDAGRYWLNTEMDLLLQEQKHRYLVEAADEFSRRFSWIVNPTQAFWRSMKAQGLDGMGRTDEAVAVCEEELELSREWGAPHTVGRTLRVLGTLKRDDGLDELHEAVEVTASSTARLEHAKALHALGSGLRRARKPTEAREPLSRALELADVCGAAGLLEQVRSELHAAGARPRRTALSGVESLTASEKRVADLAADGQTNRDIAQALFVTPKTVEVHLTNCYRKLDIRGRRELPQVMAGATA